MQLSLKRIQDGRFEFASFKLGAKPFTCILVSLTRPVLCLVRRVGRITGPMRGGQQVRGEDRLVRWQRCTARCTTATRRRQILDLQPFLFAD